MNPKAPVASKGGGGRFVLAGDPLPPRRTFQAWMSFARVTTRTAGGG